MKKRYYLSILSLLTLSLFCVYCGSGQGTSSSVAQVDATEVFSDLTQNLILPTYQSFQNSTDELESATIQFCANPNESNLSAARQAWVEAQNELGKTSVFTFGPYEESGIMSAVNFWPTRTGSIETNLIGAAQFSVSDIDSFGAGEKGLPAIEYLLFGSRNLNQDVLDLLSADQNASTRCDYLKSLTQDLNNKSSQLYQLWDPDSGNFSKEFEKAGKGSDFFPNVIDAITEIVNRQGAIVEIVRDMKIGKPLGKRSGGVTRPNQVQSPYSQNSLKAIIANVEGLQDFYRGKNGMGFYHLLKSKDADAAEELDTLLVESLETLRNIPEPLSVAVDQNPSRVEAAYDKLGELKRLYSGQVSSLFGVVPFFSDNDGD